MEKCTCKDKWQIFCCAECRTQIPREYLLQGDICPNCKHWTGGHYIHTKCPVHGIPIEVETMKKYHPESMQEWTDNPRKFDCNTYTIKGCD